MIHELEIIDSMALDKTDPSKLLLAVTDHLEWQQFEQQHLLLLQGKLNNYVNYILDEGYKEEYTEDIHCFEIIVYVKYKPGRKFDKLLQKFNKALKKQFPEVRIEITSRFMPEEAE